MDIKREIILPERLAILRRVPELRGIDESVLTPFAEALKLRVSPAPMGPAAVVGRMVGLVSRHNDGEWITSFDRPVEERALSIVVDGQIRLIQKKDGKTFKRGLGPGTLFNEEGIAARFGHRLPDGLEIGAAPIGRTWMLELSPEDADRVLGKDQDHPIVKAILTGFESAVVAPRVIQILKHDPALGTARSDHLYELAEGATVLKLRGGEALPGNVPGEIPEHFFAVVEGSVVSAPPDLSGDPIEAGTRLDTTYPVCLAPVIQRKPFNDKLYARDDATIVSIRADRFMRMLYENAEFFRSILQGVGADPLRGVKPKTGSQDVVLMVGHKTLDPPLGPLTDLVAESIATHMYDRTCVLHVLPPTETTTPKPMSIEAKHQDDRYPGKVTIHHRYVRLAKLDDVAPLDEALAKLCAEKRADQSQAHDVILVDISRLPAERSDENAKFCARAKPLTKICFVIDNPNDTIPFSLMLRQLEVVTVGLLGKWRDRRPLGLVAEEIGDHFQEGVTHGLVETTKTLADFAAKRSLRRTEDTRSAMRRWMYFWRETDVDPNAMPAWPPRTTRVRPDDRLRAAAKKQQTSSDEPMRLADWPASLPTINRWARGITGRRVGIALGGGGAFGYVHASLIKLLESDEYRIPIDLVSGSSFGAVVGAYYTGGDTNFTRLRDHWWLMTAAVSVGVVSTASMTWAIDVDLGAYDMNDIEISYYPVVTDADTGTEWSLRQGSLGRGVRASGSLPPMAPTLEGVKRYLDGGLVANVPVQVLHDEGAGLIVASNPIPDPKPRDPKAPLPIPILGPLLRSNQPLDRISDGIRSTLMLMRAQGASQERFADVVYAAETRDTTMFSFGDRKAIMASAENDPERRLEQAAQRAVTLWRNSLRNPPARVRLENNAAIEIPPGIGFVHSGGREIFIEGAADTLGEVAAFLRNSTNITKVGIRATLRKDGEAHSRLAADGDAARERTERVIEELVRRGIARGRLVALEPAPPRKGTDREIELYALAFAAGMFKKNLEAKAEEAERRASRAKLVGGARTELESGRLDRARLLALEAARFGLGPDVDTLLRTVLHRPYRRLYGLDAIPGSCTRLAWSPDGAKLARGGDNDVHVDDHAEPHDGYVIGDPKYCGGVAWTNDGKRLVRTGHGWHEQVFEGAATVASRNAGTWQVWGIEVEPNGSRVLGTGRNSATIWDPDSGDVLELPHEAPLMWATWRADGTHVVTAGSDGRVGLWNAANGQRVAWLYEGNVPATYVVRAPTGNGVAAAVGRDVLVWPNPDEYIAPKILEGHLRKVVRLAWSPDGAYLASGSTDTTIRLWDPEEGSLLNVLWSHRAAPHVLAWHPERDWLASGDASGVACLWEGESGRRFAKIRGKVGVHSVAWRPQGDALAIGRADGTTSVWDPNVQGVVEHRYLGEPPLAAALDPAGSDRVLWSSRDGMVEVWSSKTGECIEALHEPEDIQAEARWHPEGTAAVYGLQDRLIVQPIGGGEKWEVKLDDGAMAERIRWSPDGRWIVVSGTRRISLVDVAAKKVAKTFPLPGDVVAIAWSSDSTRAAFGGFGIATQLLVVDLDELVPIALGGAGVWSIAWSHDNAMIAVGDNQGTAQAQRIDGTKLLGEPTTITHGGQIRCLAWSPKGPHLASSGGDKLVRVTHIGGANDFALSGHTETLHDLAWSHDGKTIASAGFDNTARLWSVAQREAIAVLSGHEDIVLFVQFTEDDRHVLTVGNDGVALLHCSTTAEVLQEVGATTSRVQMTEEEWARYMPADQPRRPSWPMT